MAKKKEFNFDIALAFAQEDAAALVEAAMRQRAKRRWSLTDEQAALLTRAELFAEAEEELAQIVYSWAVQHANEEADAQRETAIKGINGKLRKKSA